MAHIIRSDDALGCIFVKWRGAFSYEEGAAYCREIQRHPAYHRAARLLHDARCLDAAVSADEVRNLAFSGHEDAGAGDVRRIALLASSDLTFGMMRMFAAMRERPGLALHVFRDLRKAAEWLGLPADFGDPFADMGCD